MEWQNYGEGWRRVQQVVPGYDCRVECKHEHKGNHGICPDKWFYVVGSADCALALTVRSCDYPATVDDAAERVARHYPQGPEGTDLTLHVPWPAGDDAEDDIRLGRGGEVCSLIETGRCWRPHSTSIGAEEFFRNHGQPTFEQSEAFWEAMRAEATRLAAKVVEVYGGLRRLVQCPHCRGRGVTEAPEESG